MSVKVKIASGTPGTGREAGSVGAVWSAPTPASVARRSHIGSIRLRVPAVSSTEAYALARAIGQGLATRVGELRPISGGTLRVRVRAVTGGGSVLALANEVIGRVFQDLENGQEEG